jgi:lipopolysaccharide transport system ATP-binding protein
MAAIGRLCERVLLLEGGRLVGDGAAADVVSRYLTGGVGTTAVREWPDPVTAPGDSVSRLCAIRVRDADGRIADVLDIRKPVYIELEYDLLEHDRALMNWVELLNEDGVVAFSACDTDPRWHLEPRARGRYMTTAEIPGNLLAEGSFSVTAGQVSLRPRISQFKQHDVVSFKVIDNIEGDSARGDYAGPFSGVVRPRLTWTTSLQSR